MSAVYCRSGPRAAPSRRTISHIANGDHTAIIRICTGSDGKSHFEEIHPRFESREIAPGAPS